MNPQDAIRARIKELKRELSQNEKALAIFEPKAEELAPEEPYGSRSLASTEELDKVYDYLSKHTRQKGYLVSEIAKGAGVHRRKVYNAIDRLIATRVVEQANPGQKQYRRFKAVEAAKSAVATPEPNQLKTYERTDDGQTVQLGKVTTPKPKRKRKQTKGVTPTVMGQETRRKIYMLITGSFSFGEKFTIADVRKGTDLTRDKVARALKVLVEQNVIQNHGPDPEWHKNHEGNGRAPILYSRVAPSERKPYTVRPGVTPPPYPSGTSDTV